jgi:hypothetical protein
MVIIFLESPLIKKKLKILPSDPIKLVIGLLIVLLSVLLILDINHVSKENHNNKLKA